MTDQEIEREQQIAPKLRFLLMPPRTVFVPAPAQKATANGAATIFTRASAARVPSLCSNEETRLLLKVTASFPAGTFT
jgi:hypothetical protein